MPVGIVREARIEPVEPGQIELLAGAPPEPRRERFLGTEAIAQGSSLHNCPYGLANGRRRPTVPGLRLGAAVGEAGAVSKARGSVNWLTHIVPHL